MGKINKYIYIIYKIQTFFSIAFKEELETHSNMNNQIRGDEMILQQIQQRVITDGNSTELNSPGNSKQMYQISLCSFGVKRNIHTTFRINIV
jgi:hypothetical protein